MGELEDRLNSILSDPEQMRRISSLAQSLMGLSGALGSLLTPPQQGGDKAALLEALKPWLSEKRRQKLSRAMRLAKMARLARFAIGEAGNGEAL